MTRKVLLALLGAILLVTLSVRPARAAEANGVSVVITQPSAHMYTIQMGQNTVVVAQSSNHNYSVTGGIANAWVSLDVSITLDCNSLVIQVGGSPMTLVQLNGMGNYSSGTATLSGNPSLGAGSYKTAAATAVTDNNNNAATNMACTTYCFKVCH